MASNITTTSRRNIIAALPAAAIAGAVPAITVDPIFQAIEAYFRTDKAQSAAYDPIDELQVVARKPVPPEMEAQYLAAEAAHDDAIRAMYKTIPTTVAGCAATMQFLIDDGIWSTPAEWHQDVVENVLTALTRLAG